MHDFHVGRGRAREIGAGVNHAFDISRTAQLSGAEQQSIQLADGAQAAVLGGRELEASDSVTQQCSRQCDRRRGPLGRSAGDDARPPKSLLN
jgi:hypothetical protein